MPDDSKYTSLLAMAAVAAVPIIGVWEVFRHDEPPSLRTFRLLVVLVFGLFLAVLALLGERVTKNDLKSDAKKLEALNSELVEMVRAIVRRADPRAFRVTDESKYTSLLAMAAVAAVPILGVWEVFRHDEPPSLRTFRLFVVLVFGLFLAVLALLGERLTKNDLKSEARKLEALNSELVEMVRAIVRRADPNTLQTTFVNKHVEDILGYPVRSWLQDPRFWVEHLHPEDRERTLALTTKAIQEQRNHDIEYRMIAADGRTVWLREIVNVIVENGVPCALVGVSADITARKRAGEALKKSEEKFSKAFREIPVALTLTSVKGHHYIEVNETYESCTGYRREEVIGRTLPDPDLWVDPGQRDELTNRLLSGGSVRNVECQFRAKNGKVLVGLTSAELIEIEGEPCVLAVTADITNRKHAEEALRDSEERLRLATRAGRMYAAEWDVASNVIMRSAESADILGWMDAPTDETYEQMLARVHRDDRERYVAKVAALTPENSTCQINFRVLGPDGSVVWLEENGHAFFDAQGKLLRMVSLVADVTERKLAENALSNFSRKLIEAQEQDRGRVARELRDDLNQRMAVLQIGLWQFEQGVPDLSSQAREQLHGIVEVATEVSSGIHNLSHQLRPSLLDLLGLVAAVGTLCRELSNLHGMRIQFVHHGVPEQIPEDVALCLFRIAQEALQNVVKHSKAAAAKVELSGLDGGIELCVFDSGVGFKPESVKGGSGLGLISMQERLRPIGGELSIESQPSHGTRIRIRIPSHAIDRGVNPKA